MDRKTRLERARWRCRRGMKELDVLLERFVGRAALHRLDDDGLRALEHLLDAPDQDILEWLASATAAPPPELRDIVDLIRNHALGRPRDPAAILDEPPLELPASLSEALIEDRSDRL